MRKLTSYLFLTVIASLLLSCSSSEEGKNSSNNDYEAVNTATQGLIQSMLHAEIAALSKLTSDSLSYGHSSGKVENKTQFLNTFETGASVFERIELSGETTTIVDDTAIVRHTLSATTNDPGKGQMDIKIGVVLTWIKQGDNWLLLGRQAFPVS